MCSSSPGGACPSRRPATRRGSAGIEAPRRASSGACSELLALAARGDPQGPPVLGHGPPRDGEAVPAQLVDDLLVGERVLLVFLGDDLEQLLLDRVPRDLFAV